MLGSDLLGSAMYAGQSKISVTLNLVKTFIWNIIGLGNIINSLSVSKTFYWDIRNTTYLLKTFVWNIRNVVDPVVIAILWNIRQIVDSTTATFIWGIRNIVDLTKTFVWSIRELVTNIFTFLWDITIRLIFPSARIKGSTPSINIKTNKPNIL